MAVYRPKRLFHGTLTSNEHSIEKRGVCPPESCRQARQVFPRSKFGNCHANSVYATETAYDALKWADAGVSGVGEEIPSVHQRHQIPGADYEYVPRTIYELKVPKKECQRIDSNIGNAFRFEGCGCLKPIRKCRVTPELMRVIHEFGFRANPIAPRDRLDLLCNWQKV